MTDPVAPTTAADVLPENGEVKAENHADEIPRLDKILVVVVSAVLVLIGGLLASSLFAQWGMYHAAAASALELKAEGGHLVLSFTRAFDFAVIKTSVVFMGMLVTFVGALYVLRAQREAFALQVSPRSRARATLRTASPGLVIVTLGVSTVNVAVVTKNEVTLTFPQSPTNRGQSQAVPTTVPRSVEIDLTPGQALSGQNATLLRRLVDAHRSQPGSRITIEASSGAGQTVEERLAADQQLAQELQAELVKLGVEPNRIVFTSYGKEVPSDRPLGRAIVRLSTP